MNYGIAFKKSAKMEQLLKTLITAAIIVGALYAIIIIIIIKQTRR